MQPLSSLSKVGVILRPSSPSLKEFFLQVRSLFEREGIEVMLDSISGGMIGIYGCDFQRLCSESDMLVSIGGDGTLISVVRRSYPYGKPILGINMGRLGFLTDVRQDEVEAFVQKLKAGEYRIDSRLMLEGELSSPKGTQRFFAFNEAIVTRRPISGMIHVKASIGEEPFNTYFGDGLIVATPTGSTAYNISAGGPVVYPYSKNMILTPICAHSLTQRPLVLPSEFEVELEMLEGEFANIVVDGQEIMDFGYGDRLRLKVAERPALLVHKKEHNYFQVLREKFSWGDA
ncbi:Probable inorganic polyphosphate/ATP-NAD kinase [Wolinella succinogenes]|jgi:NAD+ kinase|nr:NAD(+)/NADH kinase [Wolinella succinogenes]NLU35195.1 NAD(+) kinase [Wolinella succinogenes]VEG80802.1 Probable inorganic polyphosphate/ATP-NAD kinase [Wolinella succinogenes]